MGRGRVAIIDPAERKRLRGLIVKYSGVITRMAGKVRPAVTHQGMSYRLQKYGLTEEAAKARARAGIGSKRPNGANPIKLELQLQRAIKQQRPRKEIAARFGLSMSAVHRRFTAMKSLASA